MIKDTKREFFNVLKWAVVFAISLVTTRLSLIIAFGLRFIIDSNLTGTSLFRLLAFGGFWWLTTLALVGSVLFCYLLAKSIKAPKPKLLSLILFFLWVVLVFVSPFILVDKSTEVNKDLKLSHSPATPLSKERNEALFKEETLDELGNYEDEFLSFQSKPNVISKLQIGYQEGEEGGLFGVYPRYRFLKFFNTRMKRGNYYDSYLSLFPVKTFSTVKYFSEPAESLRGLLASDFSENDLTTKYKELPFLPPVNADQSSRSAIKIMAFKNGRGIRYITTYNQDASAHGSGNVLYTFQGLTNDGENYLTLTFPLFAGQFDLLKAEFDEQVAGLPRTSLDDLYQKQSELFSAYLKKLTAWIETNLKSSEIYPAIPDLDSLVISLEVK